LQVLALLLERAGDVVTRDELRQQLWPSSVYVDFDHGLNNAIARLREALSESASSPQFIETLPRLGYRFIYPVGEQPTATGSMQNQVVGLGELQPPEPIAASADVPPPAHDMELIEAQGATPAVATGAVGASRWARRSSIAIAGFAAAVMALGLLAALWPARRPFDVPPVTSALPVQPSIGVLPFVNMSADVEDGYFADGLSEELISKLAGVRGLKVAGQTSSFYFKGKREPLPAIAKALKVDHILEGSVRRSGHKLRITAQLIDVASGHHLWAQTFDRASTDIFQIQEEIAFDVAAALKVSLLDADEARVRRHGTSNADAYHLYLIAQAHIANRAPAPDLTLAKRALDGALERDPNFAAAHAALAQYYLRQVVGNMTAPEDSVRLGAAAAERAVALDPASSEAQRARADFQFLRYRFKGDYQAFLAGRGDMQRAIEIDPANAGTFDDFGRAVLWHEPEMASSLFERELQIDPSCTGGIVMIATLLGNRGQLDSARKRCAELAARAPNPTGCVMAIATLETYFGHFETAVGLLQASEAFFRGPARIQLWSVYMSMGDRAGAQRWLDFGKNPMEATLSDAARFATDGLYGQAYAVLEKHRREYPLSGLLDLPTAKFALLSGRPQEALEILEQRLPDLASGIEPISARTVLPALDIATAQLKTGARNDARTLLVRVAAYLDGPDALRLPLFSFQRARAYALAGEPDAALRALDRAYDEGLRTTWAIDLRPQSLLYIDPIEADPAFDGLRDDLRFKQWFERIRADNTRQLERIKAGQVAKVMN